MEDGGKAAAAELAQCGWAGDTATRFWPVGGARFNSRRGRDWCFQNILNDRWNEGARYSTVALIYAGNDLGRISDEELEWCVDQLREWASRYEVTLRLIDVVGTSYLDK